MCWLLWSSQKPLGGYMTRVFSGERTLLSPVLKPIERLLYRAGGVDETREQSWVTYAIAMLFFSGNSRLCNALSAAAAAGLPAVQSARAGQHRAKLGLQHLGRASSPTPTGSRTSPTRRIELHSSSSAGLAVHNFASAAAGIALALALIRGFARRVGQGHHRQLLGRSHAQALSAHPAACRPIVVAVVLIARQES